jgi:hypothetical protein
MLEQAKPRGRTRAKAKSEIIADEIEKEHGRILTNRQKEFARLIVEGRYSNTECARRAGYAIPENHAAVLLNGRNYPHVVEYVQELRAERERLYGVTLVGQLQRFHELSRSAEEAGQFSAAVNAEKIRSALGGLTIDRRENINTLDQLSRDEIVARLAALQKQYPGLTIDGSMKDVTNGRARSKPVAAIQGKPTAEDVLDTDRE